MYSYIIELLSDFCEGLGSTGRVQVILFLGASGGLSPNEITFPKLLQKQGYTTGLVGKKCRKLYFAIYFYIVKS